MERKRLVRWLGAVAILIGCGGDPAGTPDAGMGVDASSPMDADASDASMSIDAWPEDATVDGGAADSATAEDAGTDAGEDLAARCRAACDHAMACFGVDACAATGVDCDTTTMSGCTFDCIAATPCAELSTSTPSTCASTCDADGGAPAGDAGSGDAGSSLATCQSCSISSCSPEVMACYADPDCMAWLMCVAGASDATDARACDTAYPNDRSAAVYACQCTSCPGACAVFDPCGAG